MSTFLFYYRKYNYKYKVLHQNMIILFLVFLKITALVDVWKVQYQYILDCLGSRDCDFRQYRVEFTNHGSGIEAVVIRFCRHRAHITHKSETENDNLTKQLSAD